jgi:hypothetical protein
MSPSDRNLPDYDERKSGNWVQNFAQDQAKHFIAGKVISAAGKHAGLARLFFINTWLMRIYWGAMLVAIILFGLGVISIIQGDGLLGTFALILAGVALGVWFLLRMISRFAMRQLDKLYGRAERLWKRKGSSY